MGTYQGQCHCGAIGFTFSTEVPPSEWSVRACQCTFCRGHGALSTSDPEGSIRFHAARPDRVVRYRFGLRTADFLLCRDCGVYVGALMTEGDRSFGIVNINALSPLPAYLPSPRSMTYDGETIDQRVRRREQRWSPAKPALL
jgi:hypothetical protein